MTLEKLEHPTEDTLESYLLQRISEQEVEGVEEHILGCDPCALRLETLESELATLRTALVNYEEVRIQKELNPVSASWKDWFTIPRISWAGAAVTALGIGLAVVPHSMQRLSSTPAAEFARVDLAGCPGTDGADMTLSACRGTETNTLPVGRPLDLHLDATDIHQGTVDVQVVSGSGSQLWHGRTTVSNEQAEVRIPQISLPGSYFLRFYAPSANTERELLREFRFEVK